MTLSQELRVSLFTAVMQIHVGIKDQDIPSTVCCKGMMGDDHIVLVLRNVNHPWISVGAWFIIPHGNETAGEVLMLAL